MIRLRHRFGGHAGRNQSGISLMVVAVMLAGVGALALIAGALQPMRAERARLDRLARTFDAQEAALVEFAMVHKRLPCPADGAAATGVEAEAPGACADQTGGVVPWRTLALPPALARDRWGGLIGYRVAGRLTAEGALLDAAAPLDGEAAALASSGNDRIGEITRALPLATLLRRARLAAR
jgi:hypothetical protein